MRKSIKFFVLLLPYILTQGCSIGGMLWKPTVNITTQIDKVTGTREIGSAALVIKSKW